MLIDMFDLGVRFQVRCLGEFGMGVHGCGNWSGVVDLELLEDFCDVLRLAQKN
jgi:hypothetical protein